MRQISLTEVDSWKPFQLDSNEQRLLVESRLMDVRPTELGEGVELRASTTVGAARLDGYNRSIELRIEPKVTISRLLYLMSYHKSGDAWRDAWIEMPDSFDIPSAIAEVMSRLCNSALQAGLLQGYITVEASEMTLRGRIRFGDQIRRHFGQAIPVEVAYDDFTTDIAENRILKAALRRVLRIPGIDPLTRRRLHAQLSRLAEVSDLIVGQPIPHWRPSRLNARYVSVLRFAEMVLAGTSFDLGRGNVRVNGFMISMHKVFEDFVTKALGSALVDSSHGRFLLQDTNWDLDSDKQIRLRPDLVWYPNARGGPPGVVVDAKYKAEKLAGFPQSDVYQMLAYCTSLGLSDGHLVYAAGNEAGTVHSIPTANGAITIRSHTLDLSGTPQQLEREIQRIAATVTQATTPCLRTLGQPGSPDRPRPNP